MVLFIYHLALQQNPPRYALGIRQELSYASIPTNMQTTLVPIHEKMSKTEDDIE